MKYIKFTFVIVLLLAAFAVVFARTTDREKVVEPPVINMLTTSPTPVEIPSTVNWDGEVSIDDRQYVYSVVKSIPGNSLRLIPNYDKKIWTADLLKTAGCKTLVNGGFYDTNFRPLGWFVSEGIQESREKTSSLFNGFVTIDKQADIDLSFDKPEQDVEYGLQTGPMLMSDGRVLRLQLARDKNARRVVMVVSDNQEAAFFVFYTKLSDQLGPMLTDLPVLVEKASRDSKVNPVEAINLDGGSASVFWDGQDFLEESNTVGSWWCEEKSKD